MKKWSLYQFSKHEIKLIKAYARGLVYALNDKIPHRPRQAYAAGNDCRAYVYATMIVHHKDGKKSLNLLALGNTENNPYDGLLSAEFHYSLTWASVELNEDGMAIVEVAAGDQRGYVGSFLVFIKHAKSGQGIYKIGGAGLLPVEGHELQKAFRSNSFRKNKFLSEESKEYAKERSPYNLGIKAKKTEIRAEWGPMADILREKEKKKAAGDPTDSSFSPPKKKKSARPRDPTDS